jgi:hypothetical protein
VEQSARTEWTAKFSHEKGADRADVNDAEFCQLFGELRRPASIGATNIHCTEKDHRWHPSFSTEK